MFSFDCVLISWARTQTLMLPAPPLPQNADGSGSPVAGSPAGSMRLRFASEPGQVCASGGERHQNQGCTCNPTTGAVMFLRSLARLSVPVPADVCLALRASTITHHTWTELLLVCPLCSLALIQDPPMPCALVAACMY
jgi:hypothetical protein